MTHTLTSHTTSRAIPAARRTHPRLTQLVDDGLGEALRRDAASGAGTADGFERFAAALDAIG